jgi:hypothetical protein
LYFYKISYFKRLKISCNCRPIINLAMGYGKSEKYLHFEIFEKGWKILDFLFGICA